MTEPFSRLAETAYRGLLRLYPRGFRRDFGPAMACAFAESATDVCARQGVGGLARLWLRAAADLASTAVAMRWDQVLDRARRGRRDPLHGLVTRRSELPTWLREQTEALWFDVRSAGRSLRRAPGYSGAAVLTLALGIGANTAIFSLIYGVLLRPLPFADGDQLVLLTQERPAFGPGSAGFSVTELEAFRARTPALEAIVEYHNMNFILLGGKVPERVRTGIVSWQYFGFLGVKPLLGRAFDANDERLEADPVLVLSYDYWVSSHDADRDIVGKRFVLNDREHMVIGVLPPVPQYPLRHDIYMPTSACPIRSSTSFIENPSRRMMGLVGRVRPGMSFEEAAADIDRVAAELRAELPDAYPTTGELVTGSITLREELTRRARPTLLLLLAATGLVLVSACANVVNMTLARGRRQRRETALRSALGAGRGRLLRQQLTETTLLGVLGGGVGVLLAVWSGKVLIDFIGRFTTRATEVGIDASVMAFALGLSLTVGLGSGIVATLSRGKTDVGSVGVTASNHTSGRRVSRLRRVLIGAQVAASVTLLVGAGLALRSLANLTALDPGFRSAGVIAVHLHANSANYPALSDIHELLDRSLAALSQLEGVESVAAADSVPLASGQSWPNRFEFADTDADYGPVPHLTVINGVDGDYFGTMGIELASGRLLTPAELDSAASVAVINEAMARRYWPADRDPIGTRLRFGEGENTLEATVIGIVGSVRRTRLELDPEPEIYLPLKTTGYGTDLMVRVQGEPMVLVQAVRDVIAGIDPQMAVSGPFLLDRVRHDSVATPRLVSALLSLFAFVALVIAATGISGLVAFVVSDRTREIGIRMALGAESPGVVRMLLSQGLRPAYAGLAIGLVGALLLGRGLSWMLFQVSVLDPLTYAGVIGAAVLVTAIACFAPARRATSIDPVDALRAE